MHVVILGVKGPRPQQNHEFTVGRQQITMTMVNKGYLVQYVCAVQSGLHGLVGGCEGDVVLCLAFRCLSVQGRPGGDLLSRGLSRSTIGAEGFHFRVRDGIGWIFLRHDHQVVDEQS